MLEEAGSLEKSGEWLVGDGEMAEHIRRFDWSRTPLGSSDKWSPALQTTVGLMIANRLPMLLWWGPDYISLYNDAYVPVLGLKHPSALGLPVRECWSEIWEILKPLIDTPFKGGPSTWIEDFELHIRRSGFNEETHFTVAYSPVPDATAPNGIGGVLATVHEISEKVVAERRVAILRDLATEAAGSTVEETCLVAVQALARHSKDVPFALLYLVDTDGRQARLAAAAGIESAEAAYQPLVPLDREVDRGWPLVAALRGRGIAEVTDLASRFGVMPAGPWAEPPNAAVIVPLHAGKGDAAFGLLVAGVSSRLKFDEQYKGFYELAANQIAIMIVKARAYEEERRRADALAEIDRTKTAFFSNVSHEFRTPLTLMMGPVEEVLAKPDREVAPGSRALIAVAHRNAQRLLKLVNALLDFSRIEAGRVKASYEPLDLAALTTDLASNFRSVCERAGLRLHVDCLPLPEPVYVDREMWEKIVLNLLSNAFKFTFDGEIAVSLRALEGAVLLEVSDTGSGIPQHELPRLFERFHRVEGAKGRSYEGSGIGLALVQELVELHGGDIRVESEEGRGTRFTVSIPRGVTHLPPDQVRAAHADPLTTLHAHAFVEEALRWLPDAAAPAEKEFVDSWNGAVSEHDAARARVVVADDNADMRDYLSRLLTAAGHDVETDVDGQQALERIRFRKPDLVITDVMMPRLDGFGLVKSLRAEETTRDLPVIILSARAGEEARIEGLASGADDYVVKPFAARELLARVAATLKVARVRREAEAALREEARRLETLNQTGAALASELDLERVVQKVTDAGVELTGAQFGAFFYNVLNEAGESYMLHTLSGVDRSHFENFPMPRNTAVFAPTFSGEGIVRSDDILADPRYGKNAPRRGMPEGHLPVRSYLAVPVVSRSGEVIGGLFFGHPETGRFSERHERLMLGISAQAAVAIDNARLYRAAQREIEMRQKTEEARQLLLRELNHRVKNLFSIMAGMITMTAHTSKSPAEMANALSGRLMALARAHELIRPAITADPGHVKSANLRDVISAVVEPHLAAKANQLSIEADDLAVGPTAATSFALVLHELATNAAKYGALSVADGRLAIQWRTTEDMLILTWAELGGPPVEGPPGHTGFGSRLAQMSVAGQLGGDIFFDWKSEGVRITLRAALERLQH
ncbi:MAG: response regulator [Alphaproteobacteria bacterium]|nr:response regulator [Alphaproteobacteria bacterium]